MGAVGPKNVLVAIIWFFTKIVGSVLNPHKNEIGAVIWVLRKVVGVIV